ncbi:MAG: D-alanine--D-alanine ligase [Nitrospirae bacterium]|nr:MAG: D-alanine--D-alanine ligase [Nitrospirota bacterium]
MGFTEEETAEFDSEETIDTLASTIESLGHELVRIGNIYELTQRLAEGERWDLVFNIAEGLYGRSREAQIPALLEAYNIPYTFSDPLTLALCLDKEMAKRVVRDAGVPTADFFVVRKEKELDEIDSETLSFPLLAKPLHEGTGKGITKDSVIKSMETLQRQVKRLLIKYNQPVLVERFLSGREYTAGILGTGDRARVIGVLEVKLRKTAEPLVYSYINKELCEEKVDYVLVRDKKTIKNVSDIALRAYQALGCRDAGRVDLREDEKGNLYFLEMNPLAGLHPTHSDLPILCTKVGISYKTLIAEILDSACKRFKGNERVSIAAPSTC